MATRGTWNLFSGSYSKLPQASVLGRSPGGVKGTRPLPPVLSGQPGRKCNFGVSIKLGGPHCLSAITVPAQQYYVGVHIRAPDFSKLPYGSFQSLGVPFWASSNEGSYTFWTIVSSTDVLETPIPEAERVQKRRKLADHEVIR